MSELVLLAHVVDAVHALARVAGRRRDPIEIVPVICDPSAVCWRVTATLSFVAVPAASFVMHVSVTSLLQSFSLHTAVWIVHPVELDPVPAPWFTDTS